MVVSSGRSHHAGFSSHGSVSFCIFCPFHSPKRLRNPLFNETAIFMCSCFCKLRAKLSYIICKLVSLAAWCNTTPWSLHSACVMHLPSPSSLTWFLCLGVGISLQLLFDPSHARLLPQSDTTPAQEDGARIAEVQMFLQKHMTALLKVRCYCKGMRNHKLLLAMKHARMMPGSLQASISFLILLLPGRLTGMLRTHGWKTTRNPSPAFKSLNL